MHLNRCFAVVLASATLVACQGGGSTQAPTGPTQASGTPTPAAAGATINGQLSSTSAGTATASDSPSARATPVATVTVIGTSVTSAIDSAGRFTLTGVPPGNVQLRFTGPGTDATVSVGDVRAGDSLSLTFAVNGTQAAVLGDSRNPNAAQVPINGDIVSLTGSPDGFEFRIAGFVVRGDGLTEFYGNPGRSRADIFAVMNGRRAEVKAWPRTDFFYAERLHVNLGDTLPPAPGTPPPDDTTPPQDSSASIEGTLTSINGAPPALQLVIAGVTVRTSASTEVQRRGDRQDLSTLRTGMTVHAVGDRRPDGSIDARRLQIKDDAPGGEFEIEGSLGGLRGSCPAVTFVVNGYSVAATSATEFVPACRELKSGNKVRVRGVRQSSGVVEATSIRRQ